MLGKMISKVLKLSEYDISQFELKKKYQSENDIKNDYLRHDYTRYFFQFYLEKSPFEKIYFERIKELGMCKADAFIESPWVTPAIFDPLYNGGGLPDNFYPFNFGEIITPDVHLYCVTITSMVTLNCDVDYKMYRDRIISGDCLMDNKRRSVWDLVV